MLLGVIALLLIVVSQVSFADEVGIQVFFKDEEIAIINGYYKRHDALSKPGKKRQKGLPPGIAKNLRRGKSSPPGIAKQYLPQDLRHSLPAPPVGYERIIVDGKIVLVEIATQIVRDVLTDIVIG